MREVQSAGGDLVPLDNGRIRITAPTPQDKGLDPSTFPTYKHKYEDGRVVDARLYPNALLADFRDHFQTVWLPSRAEDYFAERDAKALPYLPALLPPPEDD